MHKFAHRIINAGFHHSGGDRRVVSVLVDDKLDELQAKGIWEGGAGGVLVRAQEDRVLVRGVGAPPMGRNKDCDLPWNDDLYYGPVGQRFYGAWMIGVISQCVELPLRQQLGSEYRINSDGHATDGDAYVYDGDFLNCQRSDVPGEIVMASKSSSSPMCFPRA